MCIFRQTKGQTGKEMEPGQHFMVPGVVHKFQMICFRGVKSSSGNRIHKFKFFIDLKSNKGLPSATIQSTDIHKT
jgi:hypothetical protein